MDEYFKDIEKQKIYMPDSNDSKDKPKKFVFQINPENVDYINSLSYEEKHTLINQLISDYQESKYIKNSQTETQKYTKLIISIVVLIIMIPVILIIVNVSLKLTNSNYKIYQGNFEKLFNN